ncbi:MAG: sugar ABC transporter permease, partial [Clostridia bacterium]|nr:sugar ABC transporter permease [Clostridia bacterium]
MKSYLKSYVHLKRDAFKYNLAKAKRMKVCYLFLLPYAVLFTTFFILPICTSIYYSFTQYNILEKPEFIGFQNYINLVLQDEVFLTSVKNTLVIAVITGPIGYILSFLFAWFINELPKWVRAIAVVVFYAPSIAGNVFFIFSIIFR